MMSKTIVYFLILLSAINIVINVFMYNLGGVTGWFVALLSQIQLLEFSGE